MRLSNGSAASEERYHQYNGADYNQRYWRHVHIDLLECVQNVLILQEEAGADDDQCDAAQLEWKRNTQISE